LIPVAGPVIATYATGWTFWLIGFGLSHAPKADEAVHARLPWPSLLILWLVVWKMKPLWALCHRFGFIPEHTAWMDFSFYDFIPACVAVLMVASGRRPRGWQLWIGATVLLPVLFLAWKLFRGHTTLTELSLIDQLVIIALLLWFWRPSPDWLARLAPVGALSYAIYIFQRPVQWLVLDHLPLPTGTWLSFGLRVSVIVALTLVVSYLAEKRLQPYLRRWLSSGPSGLAPRPL
jgi:hypothetical protein